MVESNNPKDENTETNIRPDVLYKLRNEIGQETTLSTETIESEERGFSCNNCDWAATTIGLELECPECGSEDYTTYLTQHIENVTQKYNELTTERNEFIEYEKLKNNSTAVPAERFDEAINHVLSADRAWIVFENGEPLISIDSTYIYYQ